jgi:hypothetical protein
MKKIDFFCILKVTEDFGANPHTDPLVSVRIRIGNADSDPGQPNECGSMQIRIMIHNTDCTYSNYQ